MNFVNMLTSLIIIIVCLAKEYSGENIQKAVSDDHFKSMLIAADNNDQLLLVIYFVFGVYPNKYDTAVEQVAPSYPTTVIIQVDARICEKTVNDFGIKIHHSCFFTFLNRFPKFIIRKSGVNLDKFNGFDKRKLEKNLELYEDNVDDQPGIVQTVVSDSHFDSKLRAIDKYERLVVVYFIQKKHGKLSNALVKSLAIEHPTVIFIKVNTAICKKTKNKIYPREKEEDLYPGFIFRKSGVNIDRLDGFKKTTLIDNIKLYEVEINKSAKKVIEVVQDNHLKSELIAADKNDKLLLLIYLVSGDDGEKVFEQVENVVSYFPTTACIEVDTSICEDAKKSFAQDGKNEFNVFPSFIWRKSGVNLDWLIGFDEGKIKYLINLYKDDDVNKPGSGNKTIQMAVNDNHFGSRLRAVDKYDRLAVIYFVYQKRGEECHQTVENLAERFTTIVFIKVDAFICNKTEKKFTQNVGKNDLFPRFIFRKSGVNLDWLNGCDNATLLERINIYIHSINEMVNINESVNIFCDIELDILTDTNELSSILINKNVFNISAIIDMLRMV